MVMMSSLKKVSVLTARHVKQLKEAKVDSIVVPDDYALGKVLSKAIVDESTGEMIGRANGCDHCKT